MMEDHAPGQEKHFSSGEHVQEMVEGPAWPTAELSGGGRAAWWCEGSLGTAFRACGRTLWISWLQPVRRGEPTRCSSIHSHRKMLLVDHCPARAEQPLVSRLGVIPLLQLCKCVFVFTPQFAMKTQHCFYLGSQPKDAACCLLSSPAQGPGDN